MAPCTPGPREGELRGRGVGEAEGLVQPVSRGQRRTTAPTHAHVSTRARSRSAALLVALVTLLLCATAPTASAIQPTNNVYAPNWATPPNGATQLLVQLRDTHEHTGQQLTGRARPAFAA